MLLNYFSVMSSCMVDSCGRQIVGLGRQTPNFIRINPIWPSDCTHLLLIYSYSQARIGMWGYCG